MQVSIYKLANNYYLYICVLFLISNIEKKDKCLDITPWIKRKSWLIVKLKVIELKKDIFSCFFIGVIIFSDNSLL